MMNEPKNNPIMNSEIKGSKGKNIGRALIQPLFFASTGAGIALLILLVDWAYHMWFISFDYTKASQLNVLLYQTYSEHVFFAMIFAALGAFGGTTIGMAIGLVVRNLNIDYLLTVLGWVAGLIYGATHERLFAYGIRNFSVPYVILGYFLAAVLGGYLCAKIIGMVNPDINPISRFQRNIAGAMLGIIVGTYIWGNYQSITTFAEEWINRITGSLIGGAIIGMVLGVFEGIREARRSSHYRHSDP